MPDGKKKRVSTEKKLLNRVKGIFLSKKFTAIMGPSGSSLSQFIRFWKNYFDELHSRTFSIPQPHNHRRAYGKRTIS